MPVFSSCFISVLLKIVLLVFYPFIFTDKLTTQLYNLIINMLFQLRKLLVSFKFTICEICLLILYNFIKCSIKNQFKVKFDSLLDLY